LLLYDLIHLNLFQPLKFLLFIELQLLDLVLKHLVLIKIIIIQLVKLSLFLFLDLLYVVLNLLHSIFLISESCLKFFNKFWWAKPFFYLLRFNLLIFMRILEWLALSLLRNCLHKIAHESLPIYLHCLFSSFLTEVYLFFIIPA